MGLGAVICVVGTLVGFMMAVPLTRILVSLLYGVSATDPPVLGMAGAVVFGIGIVITLIAANVASRGSKQFQTTALA